MNTLMMQGFQHTKGEFTFCLFVRFWWERSQRKGVSLVSFEKHHGGSMLTNTENLDVYLGFLISFVTSYTFSELSFSHLSPIFRVGII